MIWPPLAAYNAYNAEQALGVSPTVRSSCFGPKVDAVEHYGTKLAEMNQKLRPKQESKLEAAKVGGYVGGWLSGWVAGWLGGWVGVEK